MKKDLWSEPHHAQLSHTPPLFLRSSHWLSPQGRDLQTQAPLGSGYAAPRVPAQQTESPSYLLPQSRAAQRQCTPGDSFGMVVCPPSPCYPPPAVRRSEHQSRGLRGQVKCRCRSVRCSLTPGTSGFQRKPDPVRFEVHRVASNVPKPSHATH